MNWYLLQSGYTLLVVFVVHLGALLKLRGIADDRRRIWRFLAIRLTSMIGATAVVLVIRAFNLATPSIVVHQAVLAMSLMSVLGSELLEFKVLKMRLDIQAVALQLCCCFTCLGCGLLMDRFE